MFSEVAKSQWGSYCIQHSSLIMIPCNCSLTRISVLEHGSKRHQNMALEHLLSGMLEFATNEQGVKSVTKALKEGGKETLDKIIARMCEPSKR